MKRHRPPSMSRAFDSAFNIIKMNHLRANYGAALFNSILMKAMEDDVLRKNLEDYMNMSMEELVALPPEEKEHAFNLIQAARSGVDPSPPPNPANLVSTEDPQGEAEMPKRPMAKALDAFFNAEFIRKNVIGMQGGTEYSMPEGVASMAQRPQVPEMQPRGLFGRMKPTGEMTVGQRPPVSQLPGMPPAPLSEGPVQQNAPNPMGSFGTGGEHGGIGLTQRTAPGAQVTRMPRPSPFPVNVEDDHAMGAFQEQHPSFSGRGFEAGNRGAYGSPIKTSEAQSRLGSLTGDKLTDYSPLSVIPSGTYGDQFAPNINYNKLQ